MRKRHGEEELSSESRETGLSLHITPSHTPSVVGGYANPRIVLLQAAHTF